MPADMNDYFNKQRGEGGENRPPKPPQFIQDFSKKATVLYVLIIVAALLIFFKPFVVINSGEVGILKTAGKFNPDPLQPGLHLFIPAIQDVIVVDTRVRIVNYKTTAGEGDFDRRGGVLIKPAIEVLDARGLPVNIELTVQYRLNPMRAPQTVAEWGLNWEEKIINPVVRDVVRNVIGQYKAEELPVKRNEIAIKIQNDIAKEIDKLEHNPVELVAVQLRSIILPQKIKEQIERVQIAKQEAERVKYEVLRAKQEAEKKAALAHGTAEAKKIQAQGEADRIRIEAEAQAKANKLISNSLTNELLRLRQIEVQGKFNEALKTNRDAKIFLTPGGAVPNIWIDTKDKQRSSVVGQ
ncbi:SPFH domain-containing protein [Hydrogenimonas sp.]|uniref:SPFH domain-containing protein n=1 Tax=Hydrogenimonas sp. TaxID=2231112 RepID=UPI00261F4EDE|nr:SPFH domain-containing protein [Hydrogenimonas sp.]